MLQNEIVRYSEMLVSSESNQYSAYFTYDSSYPLEDSLTDFNSYKFSTFDHDNDQSLADNCAAKCGAGFWYGQCNGAQSNINQSPASVCAGFEWRHPAPATPLSETKLYLMC